MKALTHLSHLLHCVYASETKKDGNVEDGKGLDCLSNSAEQIDLDRSVERCSNWYFLILNEMYERVSTNCNDSHTLYLNMNTGEIEGVLEMKSLYVQITSWNRSISIVICEMNTFEMNVILLDMDGQIEVIQARNMQHDYIIDLNRGGRRWEGGIYDNQPCGYGCLYNEQDQLEYMGFMYRGQYVGYGVEYYPDTGKPKYKGTFCNSMYCGKGCSFERTTEIDWNGFWYSNKPLQRHGFIFACPLLSCTVEHLVISNGDGNRGMSVSLVLTAVLVRLKKIVIGSKCFRQVGQVQMIGLEQLESIEIGDKSFDRNVKKILKEQDSEYGKLIIQDCPQLISVKIGSASFAEYQHFVIANVDSLTSLVIEDRCFCNTHEFDLKCIL